MRVNTLIRGLLLFGMAGLLSAGAAPARPNLVYILADDLGYGDVQCLNPQRSKIPTPNLDRLAAQGMTFTDAHSGSSVCTPTRYGLLTGRYAWRTRLERGVLDNYVQPLIAADRLTVPALLKQQGYYTACIGKWHLGFTIAERGAAAAGKTKLEGAPLGSVTRDGPITRGFDMFFGFHHARMIKSVFENDRVTKLVEPVDMLPLLARRAAEYVRERAKTGQPFFLYLALSAPHSPVVPAPAWQGKSGLGAYGDFVMQTDAATGEVLAALDAAQVADNTLVIFTSDNGCSAPVADAAALEARGHFPSAQYRGYKSDIWEGGHRVPFLVRWPGKAKAGSQSAQLICLTDLMATCAELLGAKLPANAAEDSVSFLPALLGNDTAPLREAVVHHSIQGKFAIRQGQWKLCLCAGSGGWTKGGGEASPQLYDLAADPGETKNAATANPVVVQRLTGLLDQYVARGRSTPGPDAKNDRPVAYVENNAGKKRKK